MNELDPCPFCGGKAEIRISQQSCYDFYRIECGNCRGMIWGYQDKQSSINNWNQRYKEPRDGD